MDVGRLLARSGHEQVVFSAEESVGLRLIIAVHSTALGPSLGGIRFWHYPAESAALRDALALSGAMTLKASMAGLHQGGGKAVCIVGDPPAERDDEFRHALGRAIHQLGGRYIAAEDVGATQADMDGIAEVTPWVTGVDPANGGSGDPSPMTAHGVVAGMRAACARAFDDSSISGRRVLVQGAGHVGSHLVEMLLAEGADVAVADSNPERAHRLRDELGVEELDAEEILTAPGDVLSPCALGGSITPEVVPDLQCKVVCGAANNQLADARADAALMAHGIVYAPDFVVNAGGIINLAEEFTGYSRERALAATDRIEATTARVLDEAASREVPPGKAALDMGRRRVQEEGGGRRWNPGDPAAWTDGQPLTTVRPTA